MFSFSLVSPNKTVVTEELESLMVPTPEGQITVLSGHAPLVTQVAIGELVAKSKTDTHFIHVAGGLLHITKEHEVILLADRAEHHYEIDIQRAEEAKARAEKILGEPANVTSEEVAFATMLLEKNLSRINIARKHAHRRRGPITSEGVLEK